MVGLRLLPLLIAFIALSPHPLLAGEDCTGCHEEGTRSFQRSVHGPENIPEGSRAVFTCKTCHGSHPRDSGEGANAPLERGRDIKTCGDCHARQREIYFRTFHGRYFYLRKKNTPTCIFCHAGHELPRSDPRSPINPLNIGRICAGCHGGREDAAKEAMAENLSTPLTASTLYLRDVWGAGPIRIGTLIDVFYYLVLAGVAGFSILYVVTDLIRRIRG